MARIVTCTCGLDFYDSKGETLCTGCQRKAARLHRLKSEWQRIRETHNLTTRDGVLFCLRRQIQYLAEMAIVLDVDYREVSFAMDILRQQAE